MSTEKQILIENKAGAAILSCGIACFIFGVCVILVESNAEVNHQLQWIKSVGPLSGKVGIAILTWLLSWAILLLYLKGKPPKGKRLFQIGISLILFSFLMTFPPFFNLFK